jgi:predicted nuclease of restriction endonuclease-like (RecB) superfamily
MSDIEPISTAYIEWFRRLRAEIDGARKKAAREINAELLTLYWTIGNEIVQRQAEFGWGAKVIDLLAKDLRSAFPEMKGFSPRNLKYMRKFASEWPLQAIVQGTLAQLPWYHHVALMDKVVDVNDRVWYGKQVVENGWTRDVLVHQIETKLIERHGRAITNFSVTILDRERVAMASDLFKDPYVLDFVDAGRLAHERHLENALIDRIKDFLLELGKGFAFIASQYPLDVGGQDYYLDLLFYHTRLHSYIVIDLKMGDFEPEFVGKMGFYLAAVDRQISSGGDNPSIGLILCRGKNGLVVEYTLRESISR